jgi:hypothetical protein
MAEIEIVETQGPDYITTEEAARRYPWVPRHRFVILAKERDGIAKRPGKRKLYLNVAELAREVARWDVVRHASLPEVTA